MPVIKSAKKKLRKDKVREIKNDAIRLALAKALKEAIRKPSLEKSKLAVKLADKAAKNKIIHKNKASRIKSRLSKLVKPIVKNTPVAKKTKTKVTKAKK